MADSCTFLGQFNHVLLANRPLGTKLHGQGLLKCQISSIMANHLNGEMQEQLNGPVSKTGVGQLRQVQIPLS